MVALNVMIEKEGNLFVAECIELGIIGTTKNIQGAVNDMKALIKAQIEYALDNDNLYYLYKFAPSEIWESPKNIWDVK